VIVAPAALAALFSMPSCSAVNPRVLYGLVVTESSGNPFAIHDDSAGRSYYPNNRPAAATLIVRLAHDRHAFSVGLTQVESTNWNRYGVNGLQLLDTRTNVAVGCAIYRENLYALRAYNTGTIAATGAGDRYAEAVFSASRRVTRRFATIAPRSKTKPISRKRQPAADFGFSHRGRSTMPAFP
jgi:type IV secretion system protein VirB1